MIKKSLVLLPLIAGLLTMQSSYAQSRCTKMLDKYVDGNTLDLSWCRIASDDVPAVAQFIKKHHIASADLSGGSYTVDDIQRLTASTALKKVVMNYAGLNAETASALLEDAYLTSLDISSNEAIGDGMVEELSENTSLTYLSIENIGATDKTIFALRGNRKLQSLMFGFNMVTDAGAIFVAKNLNLREVSIGGTTMTEAGYLAIAAMPYLQKIDAPYLAMTPAVATQLAKNTQVRELDFFQTNFNDQDAAALSKSSSLQVLNLRQEPITNKGVSALANMASLTNLKIDGATDTGVALPFTNHQNLKELQIGSTQLSYSDVLAISRIPKLEILSTDSVLDDKGAAQLLSLHNLKEIWLDVTGLSDQSIINLINLPRVTVIALSTRTYSDDVLQAIANKKKVELAYLNSVSHLIGDKLKIIAASNTLEALWILDDHVSDLGTMALVNNKSIKQLDIRLNDISDISADLLAKSTTIQQLLVWSHVMTQEGVDALNNSDIPYVDAALVPHLKPSLVASKYKQYYLASKCIGRQQNSRTCRVFKGSN